ncbi:histidinol-phosphate aminotransferase [Deinococcus metalli]|uniref:Histidinol-phosphate aminotransferase n=1 Tax=Deinococcus metalli TaxID=1141878 RepID=A0A7W8KAB9_9DEIO|nr:histidinol-phosphate transaminase [Deinococcus metalli]MBB5374590.1 histidinol-phosphate aminotransferase [Deinococcus metalli]GHF35174.1 histidinol-phosphate aminotransferase [Deinococcus metalli]
MTTPPSTPAGAALGEPASIRPSVRAVPAYPFTPTDAPIKLDQNENPYDFPERLKAMAVERLLERSWNRYPDLHADELRRRIAALEDWDEHGVVVTPGSNVLIKLLTELAGIGQTVLTVSPTFSVYTLEAQLLGANLVQVSLNDDFSLPVEGLLAELRARPAGVLYITQPHAPTGHLDEVQAVRTLLEAAHDWVVVLDEAYHQYSRSDLRPLVQEYPNALSLRTFSKAWSLAGARAGYALAAPALAANIQKLVSAFTMNALTQAVLEVALEHPGYVHERVQEAVAERGRMLDALRGHPTVAAIPSRANFFLLRTPDADAAYRHFLERGIVVRRQDRLHLLSGCLRVAVGTPAENDAFLRAAAELR